MSIPGILLLSGVVILMIALLVYAIKNPNVDFLA